MHFCGDPLFFSHQAARSPVILNEQCGQGLPWFYICHYRARSRLGSALPSLCKQDGHDLFGRAKCQHFDQMASPQALPSRSGQNTPVGSSCFWGSTSFCIIPQIFGESQSVPFLVSFTQARAAPPSLSESLSSCCVKRVALNIHARLVRQVFSVEWSTRPTKRG